LGIYQASMARVGLIVALCGLVGCALMPTHPPITATPAPATVAEATRIAEVTVEANQELTQAALERSANAVASVTAAVAARQTRVAVDAANATATAEIESVPPFGLIGQQVHACTDSRVPIDVVVEDAEFFDHPDGGMVVIAVVRATNMGQVGTQVYSDLHLQDRRGRMYNYVLADSAFQLYTYDQKYGGRGIRAYVQPGLSARQVWAYIIPPDVGGLRIVPGSQNRC